MVERNQGHRAGFDAFMTGFCLAHHLASGSAVSVRDGLAVCQPAANKLYLSGKPRPLLIVKSSFAQPSAQHRAQQAKLTAAAANKS
eukprot:m.231356 g.231356  ORF g.231356 m.231356 type:complete len:86 (+) comp110952_c0_seq1:133-390(+)